MFLGSSAVEQVAVNHRVGGSSPSRGASFFLMHQIRIGNRSKMNQSSGGWRFLSAKSKVFLVGEYAVLFGGNAILLTIEPSFKLKFRESMERGVLKNFINSPAFNFWEQHGHFFQKFDIEFEDPYNGTGGFGASSAQYVLLYKLYEMYNCRTVISEQEALKKCIDTYKKLPLNKGINPSGADCAAQYMNRHIFFNSTQQTATPLSWSFPNLDLRVFKTSDKVNTHEHLRNLKNLDISDMIAPIQNVRQAFDLADENLLIENVNLFFALMIEKDIAFPKTIDLVKQIRSMPFIRAAKGCGALAADVIAIILDKTQTTDRNLLQIKQIIGTSYG